MKVLSLFDGISCGRVALERTGFTVDRYVAYENDKYPIKVSQDNYPDIERRGDVVNANFKEFRGFDMVIGGFPCTDLSIAKKDRKGLKGEHSILFGELVRAIREVNPQYFLVENNDSMPAADKAIITRTLGVEPIMINSALLSGQQRKRLYWTNIQGLQQPEDKHIYLDSVIDSGLTYQAKSYTITASYAGAQLRNTLERHQRTMIFQRARGKNKGGLKFDKSPTLTSNSWQTNNHAVIPVRVGHYGTGAQAERIYSVRGKSVTLRSTDGGLGAATGLYKVDLPDGDYIVRKLTPMECERLQTLPDGYTAAVSNTRRYKCLGNAWTVDVIAHIFSYIKQQKQCTPKEIAPKNTACTI